jgi:thiol-disulfide isomerase/thioredoxin
MRSSLMTDQTKSPARRRLAMVLIGGFAGVAVGLAAVYGIGAMQRNPADAACRPAAELVARLKPLARGEVAAVGVASDPKRLPDLAFADTDGKPRTLAAFHGKTVLLNLWATWCVPCRKEMPALDALQAKLGSDKFEVVAVNIDTRNLDKPKAWLREVGVAQLGYYSDSSAKVFQDLKAIGKAIGMPTTLLIDPNGCELGTLAGPAEWASDDAVTLIEAALGKR